MRLAINEKTTTCTTESIRAGRTGILVGIMLNSNFLSGLISTFIPVKNIYVLLMLLCATLIICVNGYVIPLKKHHFFVLLIIAIQFVYARLFVNSRMTQRFLLCAIGVALPCMIATFYRIDVLSAVKAMAISSLISAPYTIMLMRQTYTVYNSGYQMGLSYSLLPGIVSSIILFFVEKKKEFRVISAVTICLSLILMFRLMTRGAYLCLLAYILSYMFVAVSDKASKRVLAILMGGILLVVILFLFGDKIITSSWYYRVFGIKEKNILNGRENDIEAMLSWRGIGKFLFGTGIGSYQLYNDDEYIHNVFGQVLFEQGVYSLIFIMVYYIRAVRIIFFERNVNFTAKHLTLVFFCVGLIRLLVSYYYWIDQFFWFGLWLVLDHSYRHQLVDRRNGFGSKNDVQS